MSLSHEGKIRKLERAIYLCGELAEMLKLETSHRTGARKLEVPIRQMEVDNRIKKIQDLIKEAELDR